MAGRLVRVLGLLVVAACWTSSPRPELVPATEPAIEPAIEIERRPECRQVEPARIPAIDVKPVIDIKPSPRPDPRPRLKPNPYV